MQGFSRRAWRAALAATTIAAALGSGAPASAIVRGTTITSGAAWIAHLSSAGVGPTCTGALVAEAWVLTAAHCLDPHNNQGAVASVLRVTVGRYQLGKTTTGATYPIVGKGSIYPGATYNSKTHAWSDDLALVQLANTPTGGAAPLPLAPTASLLTPSGQAVAFGYDNSNLADTTAGAFSTVAGGQGTCAAWALCFDQTGNQRLNTTDAGGPWTVQVNGSTVGIAVTSTSSSSLKQQVTATSVAGAGSPLDWIRATTHLPTPITGQIWIDDDTHALWQIDANGFRRPISDASFVCQVGHGTQADEFDSFTVQSDPAMPGVAVSCQPGPGASGGPGSVAGGATTSCALMIGGGADCWGDVTGAANFGGPSIHQAYGISDATEIALGAYSGCLVQATGEVDCWGANGAGEIGQGVFSGYYQTPVAVIDVADATDVAVGTDHACAVLSTGSMDCWGDNLKGELGSPVGTTPTPQPVTGISDATSVAAGDQFTCATLSTGGVDCWGNDQIGQLGNGAFANQDGTPQPVVGVTDAVGVAAGEDHACALLSTGGVECWGDNYNGMLGDGSTTVSNVPVPVSGIDNAIAVTAGYFGSCALLLTGTVECWGDSTSGQLGDGTTGGDSLTPVPVTGISDATALASGQFHSCAVLATNTVSCWGTNDAGQLGDLWVPNQATPVSVLGIP